MDPALVMLLIFTCVAQLYVQNITEHWCLGSLSFPIFCIHILRKKHASLQKIYRKTAVPSLQY